MFGKQIDRDMRIEFWCGSFRVLYIVGRKQIILELVLRRGFGNIGGGVFSWGCFSKKGAMNEQIVYNVLRQWAVSKLCVLHGENFQ